MTHSRCASPQGPPPTCSAACSAQFLPFMDTYNHGSCMPVLAAIGADLNLGDLEAECRGTPTTDGGGDASAIDCSTAAGMPIAMACSQESAADAAFCESACYAALAPFYEECSALMPSYMTMMLGPVLQLLGTCAPTGGTSCDMVGLLALCSAPDAGLDELDGEDLAAMCANECFSNMFPCANDPMLAMTMGPDMVTALPQLEAMCVVDPAATGPGDGVCEMGALIAFSQDGSMEACNNDPVCTCTNPGVQEMMDCIDNPVLADNHDQLVMMQTQCALINNHSGAAGGTAGAGDNVCNEASAMQLCDEQATADMTAGTGAEMCTHPCTQEMIDCIDSPMLADDRTMVLGLQQMCSSDTQECLPIIADMSTYFDTACCAGAGQAPCPDGPPPTCTTGCAAMFEPFWTDCGPTMTDLGASDPNFSVVVAQMDAFNTICTAAHAGKGTRPPPPPPPATDCVDDPTGAVAGAGQSCPVILGMLANNCAFDLSTLSPAIPAGTTLGLACPLSCHVCGGH